MNWPWRLIVVVPDASRTMANAAARTINSTGPQYDGDAFTLPLSRNGQQPATHWGLYTSATDEMVEMMASALPSIAGAKFWRHGVDGRLVSSNVVHPAGQSWGLSESLASSGLAQIAFGDPRNSEM